MATATPPADWAIDEALVRALLRDQHPDLAGLPLARLDSGFDNELYRLGEELLVRLPRRATAVPLIGHELRWLPELAPRLPIAIPAPVRAGRPSGAFPHPWTVLPWLPGETLDRAPPDARQPARWADFLRALHREAPDDAPENPYRGVPLAARADVIEARIEELRGEEPVVGPTLDAVWRDARTAPEATDATWVHGDLHARNVVVEAGAIRAVLDWGDLTSGDPATDLASVWGLFDGAAARDGALARYGPSPALRRRARGWAIAFGVLLLASGRRDHPRHAAIGRATLRRVAEDAERPPGEASG